MCEAQCVSAGLGWSTGVSESDRTAYALRPSRMNRPDWWEEGVKVMPAAAGGLDCRPIRSPRVPLRSTLGYRNSSLRDFCLASS